MEMNKTEIFKLKTTVRILLMVAKMFAEKEWAQEIQNLANHIAAERFER